MNTVTLLGAEQVDRAAHTMREAAADMYRAAGTIEEAVRQQRINNDTFLDELKAILKEISEYAKNG